MNHRTHSMKLIIVVSILLVAGFLGTSIASYLVSRTSLRHEIVSTGLPLTSDNIYSEIQKDLLRPVFVSSMMAHDTFMQDWIDNGEQNVEQVARFLKTVKENNHAFASFFISEKTRHYYTAEGILKDVDEKESRDKWYFRVRTMPKDYELNIDPDLANADTMTIFINHRVLDKQGQFIGAIGVGLTVDAVLLRIKEYQTRYNRAIYFIDTSGKLVLGSDSFSAVQQNVQQLLDQILKSDKGSFHYDHNGKIIFLNSRFIPELNWYLLVSQTEEETTRGIWAALLWNLLICGVITIGVLLATVWTIRVFQRRLEYMATFDKLSGLYNRQAFSVLFEQALIDVKRNKDDLSILLLDIDWFKNINDTLGHPVGDRVLQQVAALIQNNVRRGDPCCRWGGEEFLILLRNCGVDDAVRLSEKIRLAVYESHPLPDHPEQRITVSIGVAYYQADESEVELVSRADAAMYQAKHNGRNRTEVAPVKTVSVS